MYIFIPKKKYTTLICYNHSQKKKKDILEKGNIKQNMRKFPVWCPIFNWMYSMPT